MKLFAIESQGRFKRLLYWRRRRLHSRHALTRRAMFALRFLKQRSTSFGLSSSFRRSRTWSVLIHSLWPFLSQTPLRRPPPPPLSSVLIRRNCCWCRCRGPGHMTQFLRLQNGGGRYCSLLLLLLLFIDEIHPNCYRTTVDQGWFVSSLLSTSSFPFILPSSLLNWSDCIWTTIPYPLVGWISFITKESCPIEAGLFSILFIFLPAPPLLYYLISSGGSVMLRPDDNIK